MSKIPNEELKEKEKLVAVLVADSFSRSFFPVTYELPKALIPICGIPMIEYTIELLTRNKINELIVFCSSLADQVQTYVESQNYSQIKVKCLAAPCRSMGDVLRELDRKQVISRDFVLITADVVGNADLQEAISKHKKLRQEDRNYILTKVFKQQGINGRHRTQEDQNLVVLDGDQILQYETLDNTHKVNLNSNVKFKGVMEFELRYDLLDTGVSICAPDFLHCFSDNFDYHKIREHVMKDYLTSEIYTDKFSAYILPKHQYLTQVKVPRLYDIVSKDLMNYWLYPISINSSLFPPSNPSNFQHSRNNFYKENHVKVAQSTSIEPASAIGAYTTIGENSVIKKSVIGRNCIVGKGVTIVNSYLWEGVQVKDGASIDHSIICNRAVVGENSKVSKGCVVSFGVEINNEVELPPFSRAACFKAQEPSSIGKGTIFKIEEDQELSESYSQQKLEHDSIGGSTDWLANQEENSEESDTSLDEVDQLGSMMPTEQFVSELQNIISSLILEDESIDIMQVEVNSFKFAHNKTFEDCIAAAIRALVETAPEKIETHFNKWGGVLQRYVNKENEALAVLDELEKTLVGGPFENKYHILVKVLYELEVVEDDVIIEWFSSCENSHLKKLMQPFIAWLEEESEEESDEESDEES